MRVEGGPILAILGGINVDLVVSGAPLPVAGQTVTGGTFAQHHGGKGGNQAVAAARYGGADVWMLGAVGDDQLGLAALEALRENEIQTDHVVVTPGAPTGVALIAVAPDGENQISVAPGANDTLRPRDVVDALERLRPHLLLASLEVPERVVRAALEWSRDHDVPVVLNPAPSQPWARDLLDLATYATPNEGELAELGAAPTTVVVIETRGARGARIHAANSVEDVAAIDVDVVDTTGAGDCFNGVLAAGLTEGTLLRDAVRRAAVAAALSVRTRGAREGMPTIAELEDALA